MRVFPSSETEVVLSRIRAATGEIVIFGAGVAGEAVLLMCRDAGIEPLCFCDNNTNKAGKLLHGLPILPLSEVKKRFVHPVFLISAADIADVVQQLEGLGYRTWHDCSQLLQGFDVNRHSLSVPGDFADYVISTCMLCHQAFRNPNTLFMRSVDLVITERCSLRCRDCANLMQYYKQPRNFPLEEILRSIDVLSSIADSVNEIRVIGGEPLMNPALPDVVKKLIDDPKFRRIIIYTNGTICPSEDSVRKMQHEKVLFFITDYGILSKNLERITNLLKTYAVQYFVRHAQGWSVCSSIRLHQRSDLDRLSVFTSCCAKHLTTVMNGVLYRCPFSANAANLRAIPGNLEDGIRFFDPDNAEELKQKVLQFLARRQPLGACDYCEGRPFGAAEIEPAVQAVRPLEYREYSHALTTSQQ